VAAETEQRPDDMATCVLRVGDGAGLPGIAAEEIELDRESAGSDRTARFLAACGLAPAAAEAAMQTARAQAEGSGRVLMQVRFSDGLPHISLQHDNVVHTLELASASAS